MSAAPPLVFQPALMLRGSRNYVHGTDIYESILLGAEQLGLGSPDGRVSIHIRRRMNSQPAFTYIVADEFETAEHRPCEFLLSVSGTLSIGWLEETGHPVAGNRDYDECAIRSCSTLEGESIRVTSQPSASAIEVVTSLATHMHEKLFPADPGTKWWAVRLEFDRPLCAADIPSMRIGIEQKLGKRLTRSHVSAGDERIGTLHFSAAKI